MFAVIETGGKQYKVAVGDKIKVEKLAYEKRASARELRQRESAHANIFFDRALLVSNGGEVKIGTPYVEGAKVEAKVLKQDREKKKIVFRYHSKTRYRKKKGHRQPFTEVKVTKIS